MAYVGYSLKDVGDIEFEEFPDDPTTDNVRCPLSVGIGNKKVIKTVLTRNVTAVDWLKITACIGNRLFKLIFAAHRFSENQISIMMSRAAPAI